MTTTLPTGTQDNSWLHAHGGALGGAWISGGDDLGLGIERHVSRYGIPADTSFIDMQQTKLSLRSGWALDAGPWQKLTVDGGWANYRHSEIDGGEVDSTFKDKEWDSRAEAVGGQWGVFSSTAIGVQLQQRDFSALGEGEDYLLPTTTKNRAAFGFAEAPLAQALRLQFGARVENVQIDGTSGDDVAHSLSFTPISGSVGLVYDVADPWRLGLALSSAARAPAQTELFAHGPHDGPATFETGDATLGMERADSAELSLRWRGERVHADGSVWMTNFNNYIYGDLTGRHCDDAGNCAVDSDDDLKELFYRAHDARFRGAEGHAQIELLQQGSGHLHLDLLADTVRAQLTGDAGNVPRIPPYHVGGGLSWQSPRFDAGVTVKYAGKQDDVANAETDTRGFTNVDAQLAWRPMLAHPEIEVALIGHNLTDSVQRNSVALNKDEVEMPGRDIRLMIRARFE
ncbi:MAG: TonB-dependent receptor [Pseudomonadota bacterium]